MFRNEFCEQEIYLIENKISCAAPAFILCSADIHLHRKARLCRLSRMGALSQGRMLRVMRIKITIELSEKRFPADYRRAFLHLMKNALSTYMNGIYFQDFFPEGRPQRKEYAFAVGLPQGSACRGEYFDLGKNGIVATLTTGNPTYYILLYNAFRRLKGKQQLFMKGVSGRVASVRPASQPPVQNDKILVDFMSPLCVREHVDRKDRYFSVEEPDFYEQVRRVVSYQLTEKDWITDGMLEGFRIYPHQMGKTVARFYTEQLECSLGSAVLCGEPRLLQELYDNGIGSRCSAGFGVFRILTT